MSELLHVVIKDHENSGYVWDEFYCRQCFDRKFDNAANLEVLKKAKLTPLYLSRMYPQVVNEPVCRECGEFFVW